MADVVQYRLERMSDELKDLEKRGLFNRKEIADIVKHRRDFEYRIKRPSPLKEDFLLYIDYEVQLDALRALRKRKIIGENKEGKKWKKSISDWAGVSRILDLYRLVSVKYRGDLGLWFRYLEFCRGKKHGRMKKVLAQALKFHPNIPGLWIYAAAWEFDQNLNVASARNLMWTGLRACPNSEDLWIEYLRMELTYLNKLKARKIALGEVIATNKPESKQENSDVEQWKEENKDLFMPMVDGGKDSVSKDDNSKEKDNPFSQQGSEILKTIYQGAVQALPLSMSLRKRFLEVLDCVDLAHSADLRKEVMEEFRKDFSQDEMYWDWIAREQKMDKKNRIENLSSKLNKAVEVFEEATNVIPSTKMYFLYIKFLLENFAHQNEGSVILDNNILADSSKFTLSILNVFEKAESKGFLSEDLACQYISFYLQIGKTEEARNLAEKLCNGEFLNSANLWSLRISIELRSHACKTASKVEMDSMFKLFTNTLSKFSPFKAEALWIMAIKVFSGDKDHFDTLVRSLIRALAGGGCGKSGCLVSSAIVNGVLQRDGIQSAREMYKRFLALPRPSLEFFRRCIELESNLAAVGDRDAILNARKLYESALYIYDQEKGLWKEYYTMEMKVGTSQTANDIYWRARKTLKNTSGLSGITDM